MALVHRVPVPASLGGLYYRLRFLPAIFGSDGGKLRMDERIDLSMSDPDLVTLLIQENYLNYRPSAAGKDDNGIKRMNLIARAAESIADGDIINVQIRRYCQWQLSQTGTLASCIISSALLHGKREILEQGERNYNRFGGWLGQNSTMGKNYRLMEDLHIHLLAARESGPGRCRKFDGERCRSMENDARAYLFYSICRLVLIFKIVSNM